MTEAGRRDRQPRHRRVACRADVTTVAHCLALALALAGCAEMSAVVAAADVVSHQGAEVVLHVPSDWSAPIGAKGDLRVDFDHVVSGLPRDGGQAVFRGDLHMDSDRAGRSGPTWITVAEVVVKSHDGARVVLTIVRETSHVGV